MGMRFHDKENDTEIDLIKSMPGIIDKFDLIKTKKGYTLYNLVPNYRKSDVYTRVLFQLLELMLIDVAAGDVVFLDRKRKARRYVVFKPASKNMLLGKGYNKKSKVPKIDFKATNYKVPMFAFDPGYAGSVPAFVRVPTHIYSILIDEANTGRKYSKPAGKKFWFEKEGYGD